ncbi:peptidylprolyl isomerase [Novosphingobium sp. TH158]|uniref:peptidylprolyl isomerase n=1 Tax=Novosphingobium sp. TH158 TaxID=2067455 RepID=UPI000C7E6A56|nr:peptidylprolyl isomerase [Novosphingobium sp. TH158]PLK26845.1 peptidylprolyl isomerase [Novosphingobium sp. TH158]
MRKFLNTLSFGPGLGLLLAFPAAPLAAQDKPLAPSEIVAAAPRTDWVAIAPSDLLVMTLALDVAGKPRRVVIQLMPSPFSEGWVRNIRKLAAARFWDGLSVNRVQDNYVVQWGDADAEDKAKARALPQGLSRMPEADYTTAFKPGMFARRLTPWGRRDAIISRDPVPMLVTQQAAEPNFADPHAISVGFASGFPVAMTYPPYRMATDPKAEKGPEQPERVWPVHCYGMVGVGRDMSPDTGSGAELYTVIGQAPRHLDRNIALVGRVIEGIENLSSLPRGTGALGFYESAAERTPILTVRMGDEVEGLPAYEYLSTESRSFAAYADARANRRDAFFIRPAGGADLCNIPVPVRRAQ